MKLKTIFASILIATVTLFSSCSSDDMPKSTKINFNIDGTDKTISHSIVDKSPLEYDPREQYMEILMHDADSNIEFKMYYAINPDQAIYGDAYYGYLEDNVLFYSNDAVINIETRTSHHVKGTFSGQFASPIPMNDPNFKIRTVKNGTFDIRF